MVGEQWTVRPEAEEAGCRHEDGTVRAAAARAETSRVVRAHGGEEFEIHKSGGGTDICLGS